MAEGVSMLLTSGHTMTEVRRYTLRQLTGFVELAARYKKQEFKDAMVAVRAGANASAKVWQEILQELKDG